MNFASQSEDMFPEKENETLSSNKMEEQTSSQSVSNILTPSEGETQTPTALASQSQLEGDTLTLPGAAKAAVASRNLQVIHPKPFRKPTPDAFQGNTTQKKSSRAKAETFEPRFNQPEDYRTFISDFSDVVPEFRFKKEPLGVGNAHLVLQKLAHNLNLDERSAFKAFAKICLVGGAASTAQADLYVEMTDNEGKVVKVTKGDLLTAINEVTSSSKLRQLAIIFAREIGLFAEKAQLSGALVWKAENKLFQWGDPKALTAQEKAWLSYFSENLTDLAVLSSERVVRLLKALNDDRRKTKSSNEERLNAKPSSEEPKRLLKPKKASKT